MKSLIVAKTGQCDNYCIYIASQYFEERNLIRTIEQKCLLKVKPFPVVNTMIIKADIQSNDAIFKIVRRY